jgi:hypothetical protein
VNPLKFLLYRFTIVHKTSVFSTFHHKKYESINSRRRKENTLVLSDFLYPGEAVVFQSGRVRTLNDQFFLYITDQRMLLHRRKGVMFKKDRIIAERLEDIRTMHYSEVGTLKKRGVLRIETCSKKMDPMVGKVSDIKAIWQEMQKYIRKEPPT